MEGKFSRQGFYGRSISACELGSFKLSETAYASGQRLPKHSHEHSYFCMTMQGSYDERYEGHTNLCRPLTLGFHPAGATHSVSFGSSEARTFNVEIGSTWMERLQECSVKLDQPAYYHCSQPSWLALKVYNEYKDMDAVSSLVIEGVLLELVAETARSSNTKSGSQAPAWLKAAKEILHDDFSQNLSLKAIAKTVDISPIHLATSFRKFYGTTIGDYVRKLRVDFACREMLHSDQSLTEIAMSAGFADQSHFCKTFRRIVGLPPSQFQNRYRQ